MTTIDWSDLLIKRRLHDNDVVTATLSANGMEETQITLNWHGL